MDTTGHRVFFTDNSWCEVTPHPESPGGIMVLIHGVLDCFAVDWARARVKRAVDNAAMTEDDLAMRRAFIGPVTEDSPTEDEICECSGFIHDINGDRVMRRNLWEAHIAEPWEVD